MSIVRRPWETTREFDPRNIREADSGALSGPETNFATGELVLSSAPTAPRTIEVNIPREMTRRRVYYFCEVLLSSSTANYSITARLDFIRSGRPVCSLPASIGRDAAGSRSTSLWAVAIAGQTPSENGMLLAPAAVAAGGTQNVILTPTAVDLVADKLVWVLESMTVSSGTIDALRCHVAVFSRKV